MLVWRSVNITVPNNVHFSLGNFIKHLPSSTISCPYRLSTKTLVTRSALSSSSYFETLTSRQKDQVNLYVHTLLEWNQRMNLTAVREVNEVMERHIEDSLSILPPIKNSYVSHCNHSINNINLVDVGSGAGLPGLILAIACPDWKVTLLESMNKRCVFLEHVIGLTGLSNVKVVRGRAELSTVFLWFVLVLQRVMILSGVTEPIWTADRHHMFKRSLHPKEVSSRSRHTSERTTK
ncbi:ribosomal rna small subunit methyltransferase g [Quercus suber]|uniref:Ribosomal rna small subunit methyltransferase g n=1 Tax=Quercus suber TaxID=58331 RepID=A0AAW0JRC7_QUESU